MISKTFSNSRVLVTGACGFIGSYLVNELVSQNARIVAVDNSSSAFANLPFDFPENKCKLRQLDIASNSFTNLILSSNFDYVFHLAGNSYVPVSIVSPFMDFNSNANNTLSLLEAFRKSESNPIIILASSAAVYGNPETLPILESSHANPISPYGASKLSAETYFKVYSHIYGHNTVITRSFSVYGQGQQKQVVFDFMRKLSNCNRLVINSDISATRDFIHVHDVVQALLLIASKGLHNGNVYNVASGIETSIYDLALLIADTMDIKIDISCDSYRVGDPSRWVADINRLVGLGYKPSVSLTDGISETYEWFRSNYL